MVNSYRNITRLFHFLFRIFLKLDSALLTDTKSLLPVFLFILIDINIFSNVPLTLLVLEQFPRAGDHLNLMLYLTFLSTIAGNLILFSSFTNLIVAQNSLSSSIQYRFAFWIYLKFRFPTTIVFSLVGMFIIFGLLQTIHWWLVCNCQIKYIFETLMSMFNQSIFRLIETNKEL